jgi:hypothetical protein
MRPFSLLLLMGLLPAPVHAPTSSYLCVADKSTGFTLNKVTHEWETTRFTIMNKYLVSHSPKGSKFDSLGTKWTVKEVGRSFAQYFCKADFNDVGNLFCDGFGEFKMNKLSLRFLTTYTDGYWNYGPGTKRFGPEDIEGGDTPAVAIGTCSPID